MIKRNQSIDLFRIAAAILIIGIHTNPFADLSEGVNFFFVQIICRLAVPFFITTSGYFIGVSLLVGQKKESERDRYFFNKAVIKTQLFSILKLYIFWSLIFLLISIPDWINSGWFSVNAFIDWGVSFVRSGAYYHLWYLLGMIYALVLLYFFINCIADYAGSGCLVIIMILLYAFYTIVYVYRIYLPDRLLPVFRIIDMTGCVSTAIFLMGPFLLLGILISRETRTLNVKLQWLAFIICFLLLAVEVFCLKNQEQEKFSYVIMTMPVAYWLFKILKDMDFSVKIKTEKLSGISTVMYCSHPLMINLLNGIIESETVLFLFVVIAAVIFSCIWVSVSDRLLSKNSFVHLQRRILK